MKMSQADVDEILQGGLPQVRRRTERAPWPLAVPDCPALSLSLSGVKPTRVVSIGA